LGSLGKMDYLSGKFGAEKKNLLRGLTFIEKVFIVINVRKRNLLMTRKVKGKNNYLE